MYVPHFVEVVTLGQGRGGHDAAVGYAGDGAQVFDVRGDEQAAVIHPERIRRVREEAQLHTWADLVLVPRERGVVVVEPHAGAELPFVRGRDRRLSIDAQDRKSTRLNSSHLVISYAVFCLKKK